MTIRLLTAAAFCAVIGADPAATRELTVVTTADLLATQREIFFTPFIQGGTALQEGVWDGSRAALHANAELWDVALVDSMTLLAACSEGLLAKIDWPAIGGRDHYQAPAVSECGVGALTRDYVLAWDRDKFPGVPTWSDFWDVAKFPGKRALHRGARMNLEIALMADGVSSADVYRTLRTEDGVDRAFRKLEQIKPYLVWWKSAAQAPILIGSGAVLLSTAPAERIAAAGLAAARNFGAQPAGGVYQIDSWAVLKASPNQADALKLLASMGDPVRQSEFAAATQLGVLAKGATEAMAPEQLANSPSNPALLAEALQIDDQFWRDNANRLDERFDAWLAH